MRGGHRQRRRRDEYQEEEVKEEECARVTAFSHAMMILNEEDDAKKCTVEVSKKYQKLKDASVDLRSIDGNLAVVAVRQSHLLVGVGKNDRSFLNPDVAVECTFPVFHEQNRRSLAYRQFRGFVFRARDDFQLELVKRRRISFRVFIDDISRENLWFPQLVRQHVA